LFKQLGRRIIGVRDGLSTVDNHPIGKTVLMIVLLLDLFILISTFDGLADHTQQLASPYQQIPASCRDIVIEKQWQSDNRLQRTANIIAQYNRSYSPNNDLVKIEQLHPICQRIALPLQLIDKNKALVGQLSAWLELSEETNQVTLELARVRGAYDSSLLEKIAELDHKISEQGVFKQKVALLTSEINRLASQQSLAQDELNSHQLIRQLFRAIAAIDQSQRQRLITETGQLTFWFPVKRLAMEMLFLLPLMLLFYGWHHQSTKTSRPYQSLVSSHLLVIVFIPVIFKVSELIYEIVPKKLLIQLFEWLERFNLVAIWHYLMMVIAIVTALILIYVMQKKIFSPEKLSQKRIAKGLCQDCGIGIATTSLACSSCGFKQFRQCPHCDSNTYVKGKFCRACGRH